MSLTLDDAKRMLPAAEAKAASVGFAYNIAVVDGGGRLLLFVRQDGIPSSDRSVALRSGDDR
jgi:uncharacterized protein GlcG (DUF336 family)